VIAQGWDDDPIVAGCLEDCLRFLGYDFLLIDRNFDTHWSLVVAAAILPGTLMGIA
jgi:hypothetical protein